MDSPAKKGATAAPPVAREPNRAGAANPKSSRTAPMRTGKKKYVF